MDVPLFPRQEEFPLARVRFSVRQKKYKATLYCVGGHIFALVITPNVSRDAFSQWDNPSQIELINDPITRVDGPPTEMIAKEWRDFLARQGGSESVSGWDLYDEKTAYRVTLENYEYLVLAERRGDQFILQRLDGHAKKGAQLFYVPAHESAPQALRRSVKEIVDES